MKTALISGITGQDGSYLAEYLLALNYNVVGLHRRASSNNFSRIANIITHPKFLLKEFDLTDPYNCVNLIRDHRPAEFYNLAAQSHVATSFQQPSTTFEINSTGFINILEAVRILKIPTKIYQASTSEMFGRNYSTDAQGNKFQNENTRMLPQSPYACSKLAAHHMAQIYRSSYDMFVCSGILFNHESPRRGENFVTRKITTYIAKLVNNLIPKDTKLKLGNILSYRDWGHAKDYIQSMHQMLNYHTPDDYVIATGETHTVQEFLEASFGLVNLNYNDHIEIDPQLYRPCEVAYLKGDSTKAQNTIKWKPEYNFQKLVANMVYSDLELYK